MTTMTTEQAMRTLFSNRKLTLSSLLEVEDKNRQLVPLNLDKFPIQADVIENSGLRDIYVKPGQVGFTSVIVGDFYIDNITRSGTVSVIISYDEFSAQRQILKAKRYHQSLQRKIPTIPRLDHKSATELSWESRATNFYSSMYIFSARSFTLGRGETIHNLLLDEYAFWPLGTHEQVMASAIQRVPLSANTKIRIGSTANGEDNPFYEIYAAAKEGTVLGSSVYKPHFYPWYMHPEYAIYPDDIFCRPGDDRPILLNMQPDEQLLYHLFCITLGYTVPLAMAKLRWRRYKRADMASLRRSGETLFLFEQEYPENDVTCFQVAGDQAYSPDIIADKIHSCMPAPSHHNITNLKNGTSATLDIWHDPDPNRGYVIGIDPGKGKTSESVAAVWTFSDGYIGRDGIEVPPIMQHCATLSGFYDEWEMAEYAKQVGYFYNGAVLAPEDNLDIVSHLRDYPDLYWREDTRTGKLTRSIGWQSNVSTKPYMITEVSRNLDYIDCQDIRFWTQCRNIRRSRALKSGIMVVGADDYHDASAIAIVCRSAQPIQRGFAGSAGWADSWGRT